jgi:NIMA-interacting peptidyl-prolyl cis-trans isomerase 1
MRRSREATAAVEVVAPAPIAPPAHVGVERIAARQLLVMYRGSRRAPPGITRTRDEALTLAQTLERRARAGEDLASLARAYSDEPGAAERGGDLGYFGVGMMVASFERAAFALRRGEISPVVETEFGFHVIQRTDRAEQPLDR